jgi:hypothetical protein
MTSNRYVRGLYYLLFALVDALAISTILSGHLALVTFFHYYVIISMNFVGLIFLAAWGWPVWWAGVFVLVAWLMPIVIGVKQEREEMTEDRIMARLFNPLDRINKRPATVDAHDSHKKHITDDDYNPVDDPAQDSGRMYR